MLPGDLLEVEKGIYTETVTLTAPGSHGSPKTIRSVSRLPHEPWPTIRAPAGGSGGAVISIVGTSYWIIDGLDVDADYRSETFGISIKDNGAQHSDHIIIRNSRVHAVSRSAVSMHKSNNITLRGNEIYDAWRGATSLHALSYSAGTPSVAYACLSRADCEANGFMFHFCGGSGAQKTCQERNDGHGIIVQSYVHTITVEGNRIHDNSGDGFQCEESDFAEASGNPANVVRNAMPRDLNLRVNTIYTSPGNLGLTENAYDIKNCRQVTISGDTANTLQIYGFKNTNNPGNSEGSAAHGEAIVVHFNAESVTISGVNIQQSCIGIAAGRTDFRVASIDIHRSVIADFLPVAGPYYLNMGQSNSAGCRGNGITLTNIKGIADVVHNTILDAPGHAIQTQSVAPEADPNPDLIFYLFNNLMKIGARDPGNPVAPNPVLVDFNAYGDMVFYNYGNTFDLDASAQGFTYNGTPMTFAAWQSNFPPANVMGLSMMRNDPSWKGYYTQPGSSARNSAVVHWLNGGAGGRCNGNPDSGAFESDCSVDEKHSTASWLLGAPVSAERVAAGGGTARDYQAGSIYRRSDSGAHFVFGGIHYRYNQLSAEAGPLGYPMSDELILADYVGRYSRFQNGSIYWHPLFDSHAVLADIESRWRALGAERSHLGYPVSDQTNVQTNAGIGRYSDFQFGGLYARPGSKQVFYTFGFIAAKYNAIGRMAGCNGTLGWPTSDEYWDAGLGAPRSNFEGGYITWKPEPIGAEVHCN
jgi:hypothetical protein